MARFNRIDFFKLLTTIRQGGIPWMPVVNRDPVDNPVEPVVTTTVTT